MKRNKIIKYLKIRYKNLTVTNVYDIVSNSNGQKMIYYSAIDISKPFEHKIFLGSLIILHANNEYRSTDKAV